MIDLLQQRKKLKAVTVFAGAALFRQKSTMPDPICPAAPVGAVSARPLIKGTLPPQNGKIFILQLGRGPDLPEPTLRGKQQIDLLLHVIPGDRGQIGLCFVSLVPGKAGVFGIHFSGGTVSALLHAGAVLTNRGQQPAVLPAAFVQPVAPEAAPLRQVQQDAGKRGRRHRLVQRTRAQCVDVLQMPGLKKCCQFRLARQPMPGQQRPPHRMCWDRTIPG